MNYLIVGGTAIVATAIGLYHLITKADVEQEVDEVEEL